jgi:PAS domain S-box-containing protein
MFSKSEFDQLKFLLIRNPIVVPPDLGLSEVVALMDSPDDFPLDDHWEALKSRIRLSCALVVEKNRLVGIFTERDLRRVVAQHKSLEKLKIGEVVSNNLITVPESALEDPTYILAQMQKNHLSHLPVVNPDFQPVGLLGYEILHEWQHKLSEEKLATLNRELEKKVAQRTIELQTREAQISDIFDNATDLIQSISPEGSILYVNRTWREKLGYTEEEIKDLSIFDVIDPSEHLHCQTMMRKIMAGDICQGVTTKFLSKDGRVIFLEGNINCRFENGVPISTRGVFRDISDWKLAENKNREIKERMEFLLKSSPAVVYTCEPYGEFAETYISRDMMGFTPEVLSAILFFGLVESIQMI